ncbi:MAG: LPS export ABC transporter periplasmic protein LptC [Methylovulum sp.]|uniref:LPS export ABC transporter periplasmic protein LptC n=1 Tax=Methylovulum sp. TaxID=1916980 RepID=UPI002627847B|nr:LPS export ABC transporter periplasmic protein LptC [Methylovulum sp.]MDD2724072.1 LPS export ABC transporter periplasmic protein LptC [Methylovulum sp.]MDD5123821.1 LPS export ABC transporter periplasmic protein LptC [Methylovulum sp.]
MTFFRDQYGYLYLFFVALASWILVNLSGGDNLGNRLIPPHSPDLFSKGYTKWEMDTSGLVNTQLFADKIVHYSDDHTTQMEKPSIVFYLEKQPPWRIQAESGSVSADRKNILLHGKVIVDRDQYNNTKALKINTSNLKVKPETHFAETDEQAELLSLPNKTTGTGMKLVFKQPIRIELLAHVQGKYERQQ